MGKEPDPWFSFYASDFLADAKQAALTAEAAGVYIRLLAHSWIEGPLVCDHDMLASLGGVSLDQFAAMWPRLSALWVLNEDGTMHQKRMEIERLKKNGIRQKRSSSAQSRYALAVQMQSTCSASAVQMQSTCSATDLQEPVHARVTVPVLSTSTSTGEGEREREPRVVALAARGRVDVAFPWRAPVPGKLHAEFRAKLGDRFADPDAELYAGYHAHADAWDHPTRQVISEDDWTFWRKWFAATYQRPRTGRGDPARDEWTCPHDPHCTGRWRCEQRTALEAAKVAKL